MSQPHASGQIVGMEPVPTVAPGAVVAGKYQIVRLIGQGGMGCVYAAIHLGLGHQVAIKLISQHHAASVDARRRFDTEAKAAARLRSRHVVQVFDNGVAEDGTPYLVMELLEGESLDRRIQRLRRIPLEDAVRIASEVARALSRAHAMGVIHRDLKPENVYLSYEEDAEVAKVLDFGIAKLRDPDPLVSGTRTGAVLGTPLFMSPEQARGLKGVDHRTDVYSLGMVIYTMLTGTAAIAGESLTDILVAICTKPLPSIEQASGCLPSGFDAWFMRACAREPAERFPNVEAMMESLYALVRPSVSAGLRTSATHGSALKAPRISTLNAAVQPVGGSLISTEEPYVVPKRSAAPLLLAVAAVFIIVGMAAVVLFRTFVKPYRPGDVDAAAVSSSSATGADTASANVSGQELTGRSLGAPVVQPEHPDASGAIVQLDGVRDLAHSASGHVSGPERTGGTSGKVTLKDGRPVPSAVKAGLLAAKPIPATKPAPSASVTQPAPKTPASKPVSTAVDLGI